MSKIYTGTSYDDWYKAHYGRAYGGEELKRKEGMSDEDWNIGQTLYSTYKRQGEADAAHSAAKSELEKNYGSSVDLQNEQYEKGKNELERYYAGEEDRLSRERSERELQAKRSYDLMQKYLPERLRENGLGGSGFSESSMLSAHAAHQNDLSGIGSDYEASRTALARDKANSKGDLAAQHNATLAEYARDKNSALTELEAAYRSQKNDREISALESVSKIAAENSESPYAEYYVNGLENILKKDDAYESGDEMSAKTITEAKKYLDDNKANMGEALYNALAATLTALPKEEEVNWDYSPIAQIAPVKNAFKTMETGLENLPDGKAKAAIQAAITMIKKELAKSFN